MALIWSCGFEGMGDTDLLKYFDNVTGSSGLWQIQTGRNNGKALGHIIPGSNMSSSIIKNIGDSTPDKEYILGFALYPCMSSYISDNLYIRFYQPNASWPLYFGYNGTSGSFTILRNSNSYDVTTQSGSFSLPRNTWSYIEINFKYSNTNTGKIVVRVNGVTVVNLTNINITYNAYIRTLDSILFYINNNSTTSPFKIDDMYLLDTTGSYNNTFLGDTRIDMINPSAAGNYSQLSPSAGDNYQCVDEEAFSNTDYVQGSNVTDKDSYNYEDVPTDLDDSNIYAVEINTLAKRTVAADNIKIKNLVRKSSTDYKDATAKTLPDNAFALKSILERDPADNSAWTKDKINACEFGVELSS